MLSNIEKSFNHIWATTGGRKGAEWVSRLLGGSQSRAIIAGCGGHHEHLFDVI